jgi:DNA-binding CsgD family transcriptional regulator
MTAKKTNWKSLIEKQNAETYRLPDGWDSRESIADALDCSPERVAEHLRPGMKAGTVERKVFPVWDALNKRVQQVTAYRQTTAPVKK